MLARKAVESPDSGQPKPPHAGSCSNVPLMSWAAARKTSDPVGEPATPGEEAGVPGEEAGALDDPAELVEELQAVNSTAIPASDAQAATVRGLGAFVIPMMSKPFQRDERLGEPCHIYDAGRPAVVGTSVTLGCHHVPFGTKIYGGTGDGGSTGRTDPPYPKHWPSPR